ncbi:agrin-like, partial [Amphibalanus amphitrite]|uniref:agrin-like n=1 Tax=Amphibalanus amphitrite TaxID=1232801 RepID=UPI001C910A5A
MYSNGRAGGGGDQYPEYFYREVGTFESELRSHADGYGVVPAPNRGRPFTYTPDTISEDGLDTGGFVSSGSAVGSGVGVGGVGGGVGGGGVGSGGRADKPVFPGSLQLQDSKPDLVEAAEGRRSPGGCAQQLCSRTLCRIPLVLALLVTLVVIFVIISSILLLLNYLPLEARNLAKGSCDDSSCPFGGQCQTGPDGRTSCSCPERCPSRYEPVCGTDGDTYHNACQLRLRACHRQADVRVATAGKCKSPDPCRDVRCPFGGRCVPSGLTFSCRCPTDCPSFGGKPVCGSDGVTYDSLCELKRQVCIQRTNVTVKFNGQCDPCASVSCPKYQVCQLDASRQASCRCSDHCERRVAPVCASDGLTYESLCAMQVEACRSRRQLKVIYQGKCSSGVNPCSALRCSEYERCEIDRGGVARCTCPDTCEPVVRPVCASDGRTYDNTCRLELERCRSGRAMHALHYGVCGTQDPCATHRCPYGGVCRSNGPGSEPRCDCPRCSDEYSPVCATDGTSYNNECKLRLEACEKRLDLRVQYIGLCTNVSLTPSPEIDMTLPMPGDEGCENKHCPHYGICESRPNGEAACTCPRTCVPHNDPVCGIDGVTYANECEMKVAACNKQQFVTAAYKGDCDLCQHVVCKFGARCEAGRCVCPTDCPSADDPVCGTDGVTYNNECLMQARACTADHQLTTAYLGPCQDTSNITISPCYGLDPVTNPLTSAPYDCSDGAACPPIAYCHRSADAAVCCPLAPATVAPLDTLDAPGAPDAPGVTLPAPGCANSTHGCCEDGETPAAGPRGAGCPASCRCHRLGALGPQCDPVTKQCACRPGVGGRRCDRCKPGFWGLPKIARGNLGCLPCGCSAFGSARDDCEQSRGYCVCKPNVFGNKCNKCPPGQTLLPHGCGKGELKTSAASCSELACYFGAACIQRTPDRAECSCNLTCPEPESESGGPLEQEVCGTDGQTYRNECQLRLFACRGQRDIAIEAYGRCADKDTSLEPTGIPFRRSTLFQSAFTEQSSPAAAKSTRHLLPEYESGWYSGRPTTRDDFLVQGWLGSPCGADAECRVTLSECREGVCQCQTGYQEAPNRQQCTAMTPPMLTTEGVTRLVLNPCMSRPCLHGGVCQQSETDHESFSCLCTTEWRGDTCQEPVGPPTVAPPAADGDNYEQPSFSGRSYLTLRAPKATIKLQLEVEFVSHAADGLLLYGQQMENGTGDFIALALVDGFVEFRYDIGNGPVVIRSLQRVSQGEYHKVVARRYHGDGQLIVDDGESIHGQSDGKWRSLDLSEMLYVGHVPSKYDRVYENTGTVFGLVGCVRRLRVGGAASADLRQPGSRDITSSRGVTECRSDPCASQPCQNGGLCVLTTGHRYLCECAQHFTGDHCEDSADPCSAADACAAGATCTSTGNGTLQCLCPPGRWGDRCQEARTDHISDPFVPNFGGSSYLQLRPLRDAGRSLELELWFLTRSPDGVLLYSGQRQTSSDFIGLRLSGGRLEFGYDLGSGAASIKSSHTIALNQWHSVKLTRFDQDGSLQVGNGTISRGSAPGHLNELNLSTSVHWRAR